MEKEKTYNYIDENGVPRDYKGNVQNLRDYLATKSMLPRYYDYHTTNKSFLNMHKFLKELGVKNHNEILQIFDVGLIGIDPFDPNLTQDIKRRIYNEIRMNYWYYLRECVYLGRGDTRIRFSLGIENFAGSFMILRNVSTLIDGPRQIGKTVQVAAYLGWISTFVLQGAQIGNVHYKESECIKNIALIENILDNLPDYLQLHKKTKSVGVVKASKKAGVNNEPQVLIKDRAKSSATKTNLRNDLNGNEIISVIVGQTLQQAQQTGRGRTMAIWMIDELGFIKNNHVAWSAFTPATTKAADNHTKFGLPHGIWCLTTPPDLKHPEGKWLHNRVKDNYYYNFDIMRDSELFDMREWELKEYLTKKSTSGHVYLRFTHDLLGYTNEWFKKVTKDSADNVTAIRQEFMVKWETHTDSSPFKDIVLKKLETIANIKDKYSRIIKLDDEGNYLHLFPKANETYSDLDHFFLKFKRNGLVLGVDVAYGMGGDRDSTTISAVDPTTLEVVMTYSRNDIDTDTFTLILIRLLEEYFIPNDIPVAIAIERQVGLVVINALKKYKKYSKYLVIYPCSAEKYDNPTLVYDYEFVYNGNNCKFDIGLNVTANTRSELMNLLMKVVGKHGDAIAVTPLVDEIKNLVIKVTSTGKERIEHSDGAHDDLVFGTLHALYAIYYNAQLLKLRNGVIVTPENFIISENKTSINTTGIKNKRIKTDLKSVNNRMVVSYFDNKLGRYVSEEEANKIILQEQDQSIIDSARENNEVSVLDTSKKEEENIYSIVSNRYVTEQVKEIKIVDDNTKKYQATNSDEYVDKKRSEQTLVGEEPQPVINNTKKSALYRHFYGKR